MCGICGIVGVDKQFPVAEEHIHSMGRNLVHRGPDDSGVFSDGHVGLGHRRLSIIDLRTGHQPMSNEDGTIWIVYNGEIYNHTDYVSDLKAKGHVYRSKSDTETIIHLYEEYGLDFVDYLRGMFALAVYDKNKNRIVLARDRLGIKPLYYRFDGRYLSFASEIKAILAVPGVSAELNKAILPEYLCNRFVVGENTFFKDINRLEPGHVLIFERKSLVLRKYWDIRDYFTKNPQNLTEMDALSTFSNLFRESVKLRLMSDVPLGLFLSGGIDSSAICAVMSKMVHDPIETFSVGFREREANELHFARLVANHYHTVHREIVIDSKLFFRALPELIWHEDEPIAFSSSVPLYFVSRLAKSRVKVVLTGEGSDELMGGYAKYYKTLLNLKWGFRYNRFPKTLRNTIANLIRGYASQHPMIYKINRTFLTREPNLEDMYFSNFSVFFEAELPNLLMDPDLVDFNPYAGFFKELEKLDPNVEIINQLLLIDLKTYLHELLMKQDQMSMAASVESRVPFLDHHLVQFLCQLPGKFKIRGKITKILLRLAMEEERLPQAILYRSKMGFPVPLDNWFRGIHRDLIQRILLDGHLEDRGLFRMNYVQHLLEAHWAGKANNGDRLWSLLNLELWCRRFLDREEPQEKLSDLGEEVLKENSHS